MVAVPESPDVLIEAPKKELRENLKGEDGADESSIQFSTEGEEDSKQMQQRNDRLATPTKSELCPIQPIQ